MVDALNLSGQPFTLGSMMGPQQQKPVVMEQEKSIVPQDWQADVAEIRGFLDEDYSVPITSSLYDTHELGTKSSQLAWGRIGIEKWMARVKPVFKNTVMNATWRDARSAIKQACRDAVSFGNSTIIVNPDGSIRVSIPELSCATRTPFSSTFVEDYGDFRSRADSTGELFVKRDGDDDYTDSGSMVFSIFYKQDGSHPHGLSRISPAVRDSIRAASRTKIRAEIAADFYSYPQRYLNGVFEDMDPRVKKNADDLVAGIKSILAIPKDPDTGEKLGIGQFQASDFEPFLKQERQSATEVATALSLTFEELGVVTTTPQSADAIYASKEALALEIQDWEDDITSDLQAFLVRVAELNGEDAPELAWQEPALPSKASAADAAIKLASAFPALKDSTAVWSWAGLPQDVLEEAKIETGSYVPPAAYGEDNDEEATDEAEE